MRGVGHASGAITFVNALPTGVGCAAAVDLPVEARVEVERTGAVDRPFVALDGPSDTPLVRAAALRALERFTPDPRGYRVRVAVRSAVPVRKGLKSSSAVSCAVLEAVARAVEAPADPEELARLAADVGVERGLSATGGFDDCLAAARGGVALADNPARTVLGRPPPPTEEAVVLWVPESVHDPSPAWLGRFRAAAGEGDGAVAAARAGRWAEAMRRNTELVERTMGYPYASIRSELHDRGATMSGVTGMGPALAALGPEDCRRALVDRLTAEPGSVLSTTLRPDGAVPGGRTG